MRGADMAPRISKLRPVSSPHEVGAVAMRALAPTGQGPATLPRPWLQLPLDGLPVQPAAPSRKGASGRTVAASFVQP